MSEYVYIFSYGSNTLLLRIKERVSSVQVVSKHELKNYQLAFNKQSIDGSTKANIVETGDPKDSVWGVVHKIKSEHKLVLDRYEALGMGYDQMTFNLKLSGSAQTIYAYMATEPQYLADGQPYNWYLSFVIEGAIENGFPEGYIKELRATRFQTDTNTQRRELNEAILERASVDLGWPPAISPTIL